MGAINVGGLWWGTISHKFSLQTMYFPHKIEKVSGNRESLENDYDGGDGGKEGDNNKMMTTTNIVAMKGTATKGNTKETKTTTSKKTQPKTTTTKNTSKKTTTTKTYQSMNKAKVDKNSYPSGMSFSLPFSNLFIICFP